MRSYLVIWGMLTPKNSTEMPEMDIMATPYFIRQTRIIFGRMDSGRRDMKVSIFTRFSLMVLSLELSVFH